MSFAEDPVGLVPFPYQRWLLIHALELRPDGRFRFRTILVLVARQNGKTTIVEIKNLWKLFVLRVPLVIGTAQNLDIAEESWDKAVEIIESVPELAAELEHVDRTNGKKQLRLKGGCRWKITAASRKGGRGLAGGDVNLDELREHQNYDAWGAVTKTTMAQANAQTYAYSNAGDDKSRPLNDLQAQGRAAALEPEFADPSFGCFEWSAPDGCPVDDERFWPMANPSLGYPGGVELDALRSALKTDPEPVFRTECLCQRVPKLTPEVITAAMWDPLADPSSEIDGPVVFGIGANPEHTKASVGAVGPRTDGRWHVETAASGAGLGWVVPWAAERQKRWAPTDWVLDPASAAGALLPDLKKVGIEPYLVTGRENAQACGAFYDDVIDDRIRHLGQDELDRAVAAARKRYVSDAWKWERNDPDSDITELDAVTLARHGAVVHGRDPLDDIW